MTALWQRDRTGGDGLARTIDVALTESVLSMMVGMLPEYGALGKIKAATGGGIATAAPRKAYPTRDRQWVRTVANSDPPLEKLKLGRGACREEVRIVVQDRVVRGPFKKT